MDVVFISTVRFIPGCIIRMTTLCFLPTLISSPLRPVREPKITSTVISPGVDVAADRHVDITAAQDAQVSDLDLGDDNRLALEHDELDNAIGGAYGEEIFGNTLTKT